MSPLNKQLWMSFTGSGRIQNLLIFAHMIDQAFFLDNPIWSALSSDNSSLGSGTDQVKIFHSDVAPFAGLQQDTPENFQTLFDFVEDERAVVLFSPKEDIDPSPFEIVVKHPGYQMFFEGELPEPTAKDDLQVLLEKDVPAMLALTQLAQPGPFARRTIEFGGYLGIFARNDLVAMGGQRLKSKGCTEISAVCSHPDHIGRGYAGRIIYAVARDIVATGNLAYLHVRADNTRAVELYRRLGFVVRTPMNFYILRKPAELRLS